MAKLNAVCLGVIVLGLAALAIGKAIESAGKPKAPEPTFSELGRG